MMLKRHPEFTVGAPEFLAKPKYTSKCGRALGAFVKAECANWDRHYCCCDDQPCRILSGQPCGYFEASVLGPPDYPYRLPGYDYEKLFDSYRKINPKMAGSFMVKVRKCPDCGEVLPPRRRYCDRCSRLRGKAANRERARKHRKSGGSNVTV